MSRFRYVTGCLLALGLALASPAESADSQDESELSGLKREIETMKRDHEARLDALEEELQAAEGPTEKAAPASSAEADATETDRGGLRSAVADSWQQFSRTFNPQISVILQGRIAYLQGWDDERPLSDYPIGGTTDRGHEGISLGESELVFSSNVDDKFYGFFNLTFDQDDIEIEEAFFSTLSLPLGLGLKGGQFLSSIGYHNDRHSHTWDFVDAPLVYEAMLDGSLSDPGVQISWIAPTDLYIELGSEVFRGDDFPAEGAAHHGFGTATLFAKLSGDLGDSSSWKTGLSYLRSESDGRTSETEDQGSLSFEGSTDLLIADFVWKWAPLGNFRERNFTFQTEYMHRRERGHLFSNGAKGRYRSDQDGFYVQGVYQFVPRWRAGLRYGQLWGDNHLNRLPSALVDRSGSSPRRISAMVDFSNSEFSRFRLQYSFETGGLGGDSLVYLQYIISIGSHGAHIF